MFIVDILRNLRDRAEQRELVALVSDMTDGQVADLGLAGLRDARQHARTLHFAASAGWGPWRVG